MNIAPFNPAYTQGQVVAPTGTAASITVNATSKNVCLTNLGANVCYVRLSDVAISATTSDYPVPPGIQCVITKQDGHNTLSHISALGTSLHVIVGEGF